MDPVSDSRSSAAPAIVAAAPIKASAKIFDIVLAQLARSMEADFVQHPGKIIDAADLNEGAAQIRNIHGATLSNPIFCDKSS